LYCESINPGKPQVKHNQIVSSRVEHSQSLETRARFIDPIASKAKRKPEQSAVIVVVFYNQDARRRHRTQLIPIRADQSSAAERIGYPRACVSFGRIDQTLRVTRVTESA
jgi:hypothetical protein